MKSIVLHEVGHSIDYLMPDYLGFSSEEDKEFINIYKKEKDILYNDNSYPRSTPAEYFAEAFQDYFINRMSLMEKAPLTYKYIDKLVKILNNWNAVSKKSMVDNSICQVIILIHWNRSMAVKGKST